MKKSAFIHIRGDSAKEIVAALRNADGQPPAEVLSLAEFERGREAHGFLSQSALPASFAPDAYHTIGVSLPLSLFDLRVLTLPFTSRETLYRVIPFELEQMILDSPGEIAFDFLALARQGEAQSVLVAFMRKSALMEVLDALDARGIDPEIVTCLDLLIAAGRDLPALLSAVLRHPAADTASTAETAARELASPSLNLRRGDFACRKKIDALSRRLRITAVLAAILAVLLNASLSLHSLILSREAAATTKETRAIYATLFPQDRKITDETYQTKAHLRELRMKGDLLIGSDPLGCLSELSAGRPPAVVYHEITISRDTITVRGESPSAADLEKAKTAVAGMMAGAPTADLKQLPDGKVSFSLSGRRQK